MQTFILKLLETLFKHLQTSKKFFFCKKNFGTFCQSPFEIGEGRRKVFLSLYFLLSWNFKLGFSIFLSDFHFLAFIFFIKCFFWWTCQLVSFLYSNLSKLKLEREVYTRNIKHFETEILSTLLSSFILFSSYSLDNKIGIQCVIKKNNLFLFLTFIQKFNR